MSFSTYALIATVVVAAVWTLLMKATVRVGARTADNGWDNAIAYLIASALLAIPVRWMFVADSVILTLLIPPFVWAAQTLALRTIYQVRTFHAWLLGIVHAFFSSVILGAFSFVVAYFAFSKIIADPLKLLEFLLKLIGVIPK